MTLAELKTKADAKLIELWTILLQKQEIYKTKHGRYFQLLATNEAVDGADVDFVKRLPAYEKNGDDIDLPLTSKIPFVIEVHQSVDPTGQVGFTAMCMVTHQGKTYQRKKSHLVGETHNWERVYSLEEESGGVPPVADPIVVDNGSATSTPST